MNIAERGSESAPWRQKLATHLKTLERKCWGSEGKALSQWIPNPDHSADRLAPN